MQPANSAQWNLRYLLSEAIRNGCEVKLDGNGNVMVVEPNGGAQLLTEQSHNREVSDGKRRGYNGKQPRTTDGTTHPVMVTTADGRKYELTRNRAKSTQVTKEVTALIKSLPAANGGNRDI